jgi:hypothetical protein
MTKEQLDRLLNTACEIITSLEGYADGSLKKDIDVFFNEVNYSNDIDDEIRINYSGDDQVQDWDVFGNKKV